MNKDEIAHQFVISFNQANNNITAAIFSNSIRFIAIMLVILAVMWSINHFLSSDEKECDGFVTRLGSRIVRLVIGLTLFMLLLIVKGK